MAPRQVVRFAFRVFETDQRRQQIAIEVAAALGDGVRVHAEVRLVQGQEGRNAIEIAGVKQRRDGDHGERY
jgi:hypothetical protein